MKNAYFTHNQSPPDAFDFLRLNVSVLCHGFLLALQLVDRRRASDLMLAFYVARHCCLPVYRILIEFPFLLIYKGRTRAINDKSPLNLER